MPKLLFMCPPGTPQPVKLITDKHCLNKLAAIEARPQEYKHSKCVGCTGPVRIDEDVSVGPAPAVAKPHLAPAPALAVEPAPSPPPEPAQAEPEAPSPTQEPAPAEIAVPGANGEPGHLGHAAIVLSPDALPADLELAPGKMIRVKASDLCLDCGERPAKLDSRGYSTRRCVVCLAERARANAKIRAENLAQAKRVIESAASLARELPARPEPPLALVRLVKDKADEMRDSLYVPELAAVHASALLTAIEALAAAGGIPGWEEVDYV